MTETQCGWPKWLAPGQPAETPGVCAACGIAQTYGGVKRCMKRGRTVTPSESQPVQPAKRLDWFTEHPCPHQGEVSQTLGCGCAGQSAVTLRICQHFGCECTATDGQRAQLLKKHRAIHDACRSCESCSIREAATHSAEVAALDSPSPQ